MQVPSPHGSFLETLVQPCVPPLKREAGKPEGYVRSQVEGSHKEMKAPGTEITGVA